AGLDANPGPVVEHGRYSVGSTTETKRRSPLVRNEIVPVTTAKIESSRPICVPGPGRNRVPRWRTMMLPGCANWPSNIFTPRYFGFESRPFFEEPRPFLCAMVLVLLRLQRRLERRDRALARGVRLLVLERGFEHRPVPGLRALAHLGDGHLLVAVRHALDVLAAGRGLGRRGLGRRRRGLGGGRRRLLGGRGLARGARRGAAAKGDLDAGRGGPEAVVAAVAGAALDLGGADLRP